MCVCVLGLIGNLADLGGRLVLVYSSTVTGLSGTALWQLCGPAACMRDQTCIYRLSRVCAILTCVQS